MENTILLEKSPTLTIFSLVLFFLVISILLVVFFFLSKKKIIQKTLEKKELELFHQKELLEANLLVQEKERKRIGGEIHDDINSQLSILGLFAQSLGKDGLNSKEIQEIKNNLLQHISKTNENSRRISHSLYPPILEKFGLIAALEDLINDYKLSEKIDIVLEIDTHLKGLNTITQLHIYRIFQELISNSIKHGNATKVKISSFELNDNFNFIYEDNGVGFDLNEYYLKKTGLGMKNIENRIYFLNGDFTLDSKPLEGINFKFSISKS